MATTTIDNETELSAVNSILGAIGQAPVTTLGETYDGRVTYANPEVAVIYNLLREANMDVQSEGWSFNIEQHVKVAPDTNDEVVIPSNVLQLDVHDSQKDRYKDVIRRSGKLYNKSDHKFTFTDDYLYLDYTYLYPFEDIPHVFKRYITYAASTRAAAQLVGNPQLVQLLQGKEMQARAACVEYECNQGDHNYLGFPHESSFNTYKPYIGLAR